jgi:hypothetical protein
METPEIINAKSLKWFIKGSLTLIGLLFILSFGVTALLLCSDKNVDTNKHIEIDNSKNDKNKELDNNVDNKTVKIDKTIRIDKNIVIVKNIECNVIKLILFLVGIPMVIFFIVLIIFPLLVKTYNKSPVIKNDKKEAASEAYFMVGIKPDSEKDIKVLENLCKGMFERFTKTSSGNKDDGSEPEK